MDWFGAGGNGPLIVARAIHFAATAITAGSLVFGAVVAKPALRSEEAEARLFRARTLVVAWLGLAIVAASGVIWFWLQAAAMSGLSLGEIIESGVVSTVLNRTQFGQVAEIRFALAMMLAVCLAYDRFPLASWLALAAAFGLTVAIAWSGHAGSTLGERGNLHLAADGLHLFAAAAWIGGLVSLLLLLVTVRRNRTIAWASLAQAAASRFSTLGIISVATLLVTGMLNAWILVGSFHALAVTEYGRLLMLKIVAFAVMLAFAALNRLWLTPRLRSPGKGLDALRQLTRNSTIEIALGLTVFALVGMLGTLHPATHLS
ncbi:copper homeostasis membrane protein CopD [Bradyrhizobium sp.]|uniref:copper homeostasis membrane protein CopD n=1 Tax=Bradyrhizobium sp. TaxID=376 RepID=UPI003C70BD68